MKFTWKDTNLLLWKIRVSTEQKKNWFTQPRFWTWETNLGETAKRVLIHLWLFHARRTFTTLWNKSKLSIWKWVKWQRHVFTYHTQTFDCFWSIQLCSWVANRNPLIREFLDWKQNCSFIHFFLRNRYSTAQYLNQALLSKNIQRFSDQQKIVSERKSFDRIRSSKVFFNSPHERSIRILSICTCIHFSHTTILRWTLSNFFDFFLCNVILLTNKHFCTHRYI